MIRAWLRAARHRRDLRIAQLCETTGYLPSELKVADQVPVPDGFPAIAEHVYNGDRPHCPRCRIGWDNDADRCGLIPCPEHCPNCTGLSPCIRHDEAFWGIVAGLQAKRRVR